MTETEQKPAAKKVAKPKKASRYPAYKVMIAEAITSLAEKGGSSRQAIMKYIVKRYKVSHEDKGAIAQVRLALRRGVTSGTLKQSKGTGASGSFKLASAKKEEKKKVAKPKTAVKPKAKKAKSPKKVTKSPKKADKKVKKAKTAKPAKKAQSPKKVKKAAPKKVTKAKPKTKKAAKK
ncbi:histone H1.0-B-like [Argonauta hians]